MMILCQGRDDNPLHTETFNVLIKIINSKAVFVLIKNLKEKNLILSKTTLDCESSVTRTLFVEENSDGTRLN